VKYRVDFLFLPKDAARPQDEGEVVPIEVDEKNYALIPNVGDCFSVDASALQDNATVEFSGRVRTRYFHYLRTSDYDTCIVNIVVEEVDTGVWASLLSSDA